MMTLYWLGFCTGICLTLGVGGIVFLVMCP
jgi:hypothetical protein